MPRLRPSSSLLVLTLALHVACKADGPEGMTDSGTGAATDAGTTDPTTTDTSGAPLPGLGAMCDHDGDLSFESGFHLSRDESGCASGRCVFPDTISPPASPCTADADCNLPEVSRFVCIDQACAVSEAYKRERSMCTQTCAADQDCAAADPATTCSSGFVCVTATPDCCEKQCICNDDVAPASVDEATAACAMDPNPDCPL